MKTITLDLTNIETVRALHIYLAYMLDLPAHYGKNLDALHDCLGEISENTHIILRAHGARKETSAYLPKLLRVLQDAADENPHLTIALC